MCIRDRGLVNQALLIENMNKELREFKIFLPLYDGIKTIEIGVDSNCEIKKPKKSNKKPIVFYGTSITQGGCASRPGMAHTNIISRKLDIDCINFGFSGNGRMEQPIAELISEIDPLFYIIECMPNMFPPDLVSSNTIPLVDVIRSKNPNTPIVLVDLFTSPINTLDKNAVKGTNEMNNALKNEYKKNISINAGNSGTLGRLITGILIDTPFPIKMIGDKSLSKRDFSRVIKPLKLLGVNIKSNKDLIHRLNRAIGQIEAIKRDLSNDQEEQDCVKTFNQLKASINALKKFGQIYMSEHLDECLDQGVDKEEISKNLKPILNGIFKL